MGSYHTEPMDLAEALSLLSQIKDLSHFYVKKLEDMSTDNSGSNYVITVEYDQEGSKVTAEIENREEWYDLEDEYMREKQRKYKENAEKFLRGEF